MEFGTSSTTTVRVTPTHISPMMLDGMRLMKAHGGFRNRAPAAKGAAISCNDNNNNSLFDPNMKNTIRNTILENKLRYGHPKKPSGLV